MVRAEIKAENARRTGEDPLPFVGFATLKIDIGEVAAAIRAALDFDLDERAELRRWTDALRRFIEQADDLGILVLSSGVVLNNTRRKLDPQEFRGFALVDEYAPVVFVNGADTRAAQMFTLGRPRSTEVTALTRIQEPPGLADADGMCKAWLDESASAPEAVESRQEQIGSLAPHFLGDL